MCNGAFLWKEETKNAYTRIPVLVDRFCTATSMWMARIYIQCYELPMKKSELNEKQSTHTHLANRIQLNAFTIYGVTTFTYTRNWFDLKRKSFSSLSVQYAKLKLYDEMSKCDWSAQYAIYAIHLHTTTTTTLSLDPHAWTIHTRYISWSDGAISVIA